MTHASLLPLSAFDTAPVSLDERVSLTVGSDAASDVTLPNSSAAARQFTLERIDGRWLITGAAPGVTINGIAVSGATRLFDRDIIACLPSHRWEFVSGEQRTVEMPRPEGTDRSAPRRRKHAFAETRTPLPIASIALVLLAAVLVVVGVVVLRYGPQRAESALAVLSDAQATRFDSLLVAAYDHLERGNSLLELGIQDEAALEFARGINTLALSELRNHPQVKPRIAALEASIASIYRARKLTVPDAYAGARGTISADKMRPASLSVDQFAHAFELVSSAYRLRFHQPIVVVGRDHPEHLALYGPGGALDLRSMFMSPEQIAFVIAQSRSFGIRVKDFSQDSILRLQVAAAVRAGLAERAGTGLHLHIDRFADRRDRWTIGARPERRVRGQIRRNLSLAIPATETSSPSSNRTGSPRSSSASLTYVPLSEESMRK